MAALKYFWQFGSMAADTVEGKPVRRQFRAEIWDMRALPQEEVGAAQEVIAGENPFSIEWPSVEKFEPIMPSVATFELMSTENFQHTALWTEDAQQYQVRLSMRSGAATAWKPVWCGWLNAETYEEELYRFAGNGAAYPVTFYASDFNVLKRRKFQDEQGNMYSGLKPLGWYFDTILRDALNLYKLDGSVGYEWLSTTMGIPYGADLLTTLYINAANFYDEDGVAMSMYEVIEEILRPFTCYMVGFVYTQEYVRMEYYHPLITDYNYLARPYAQTNNSFQLPDTILRLTDGRQAATGTAGTAGSFSYEPLKNGLTVTSSRYATNTVADWKVEADELEGLIDTRLSEEGPKDEPNMERRRYTSCKNFVVSGEAADRINFWQMRMLDGTKEEVWCCIAQREETLTPPAKLGLLPFWGGPLVFEDTDTQVYPNDTARLVLNMQIKVCTRRHWNYDNWRMGNFLRDGREYDTIGELGGVIVFSAFELIGADGTVLAHLAHGWNGRLPIYPPEYMGKIPVWEDGPDVSEWGRTLFTAHGAADIEESKKMNNMAMNIEAAADINGNLGSGLIVPMPQKSGHLRWTLKRLLVCANVKVRGKRWDNNQWYLYGGYDIMTGEWMWGWKAPIYGAGFPYDLNAILINDVTINTEDGYKYELSDEDYVHTSYINMNAENAMEDVTVKVCNSYEDGMAIGHGDLFYVKNEGKLQPIPRKAAAFSRGWQLTPPQASLEELLVRTYHSNFTGKFVRFEVESQYALPCAGLRCQYGQYSKGAHVGEWVIGDADTWFFICGQQWDCKAGTSKLDCVQISTDNKDLIPSE
jgi:hypothetical protein